MKCQACKLKESVIIEKCDDEVQPYILCEDCHHRLLTYSLRPIEWYNLAVIHTFHKFLLHDDFYEDDGNATQPQEDIIDQEKLKAPELNEVKNDLELLIDYCIAKWWLSEETINILKNFDKQKLFDSIKSRFNSTENYCARSRLYEISSKVLGRYCEGWIREKWKSFNGDYLIELSEAAALCLPIDEGYNLVINALKLIPVSKLPNMGFACLYLFRSPKIFDWIEQNVSSPIKDSWGRLGAASNPTWPKMCKWIDKGRPLSLVAIDTLIHLIPHQGEFALNRLRPKPKLINAIKEDLMTNKLNEYLEKDNSARARLGVERIVNSWGLIEKG